MDEDARLIEASLGGDEASMEELVMKYQRRVYALAYRLTGNVEDAKDVTQNAFIRAFAGLRKFRGKSSFFTWLYRICVNLGINHMRKHRNNVDAPAEPVAAGSPDALRGVEERQRVEHLNESLSMLPKRQRMAVVLRVHEGLNIREASEVMGCSEGAVKAHYHQGIRKLKEKLREKGHEITS